MATESGVILPVDSTGKALRTETVTTTFTTGSGGLVHQQVICVGDPATVANLAAVDSNGRLSAAASGAAVTCPAAASWTSATALGTAYTVTSASLAGNITFWIYNTSGASPFTGTPAVAFEQSPDGTNWAPLQVTRSDTSATLTALTVPTMASGVGMAFDAALEGVTQCRVRLTAAPGSTNGMAVIAFAGGGFFEPSVSVIQQPIAKGTQGTTGVATQDLKDSGRTLFYATGSPAAPTAGTETLVSLTPFRGTTGGSAATTGLAVTAGKTLRLTGMSFTVRQAGTAAIGGLVCRLRVGTGTLTVASPILATVGASIPSATANVPGGAMVDFPDGLELSGSQVFTASIFGTAHPCDVTITGFEY